jgi:methylated-DNA-[protein]-cysteine S-methyltransferase
MGSSTDAGIYARESSYLDQYVQIGVASGRVLRVTFPDDPEADATTDHAILDLVFDYLDGIRDVSFADVDVALTLPTDQRSVLENLRSIPYGDSIDVTTLASMTPDLDPNDSDDLALVRTALGNNPAPLLIPDHRVRDGPSAAPPGVEQKFRAIENL